MANLLYPGLTELDVLMRTCTIISNSDTLFKFLLMTDCRKALILLLLALSEIVISLYVTSTVDVTLETPCILFRHAVGVSWY